MKEKLKDRLQQLKEEFANGQKQLAELEARKAQIQETMLRISGAIQVLDEELSHEGAEEISERQEIGVEG